MTVPLGFLVEELGAVYRHGGNVVLLFDYDGTLTPIVDHPSAALLDRRVRRALACLAKHPRVHVGILSGRQLDELKRLVRLPNIYLAGTGGLELDLRGMCIVYPQSHQAAALMDRFAARLEKKVAAYCGAWLEEKRLGLTVHYRTMSPRLVAPLRAELEETRREFGDELRIVDGPKAWEITPAWGWTKGSAVRFILADLGDRCDAVLYAGDGANDAEAVREVNALGGITLGIGPDAPSAAQHGLDDPTQLRTFLLSLDASLSQMNPIRRRSVHDYLALYGVWKSTLSMGPL